MRKKYDWEIKSLGEIATEIYRGNEVTRAQLGTGDYPAVKCGDINSSLTLQFHKCISFVNPDLIENKKYFEYEDILISNLSNKLETLGKCCIYLGKYKCIAGNDVTIIKYPANPKYLTYSLSSDFCRRQIESLSVESTVFHLYPKNIKQLKIPLPSLEEQERIVSILDKFHTICGDIEEGIPKLIKDVTKQYEYYRDQIFPN